MSTGLQQWQLLPPDLIELQLGQIQLLQAMYPDEITVDNIASRQIDTLRAVSEGTVVYEPSHPSRVHLGLRLLIDLDSGTTNPLVLDFMFPFTRSIDEKSDEPPSVKVRVQQPAWLNKASTAHLTAELSDDLDLLGIIDHITEAGRVQFTTATSGPLPSSETTSGPLVRVWFYFPSISTRSKRDDFIINAPSYQLTGFLYAGKPGLLCLEGESQAIDDYMKFIKTESWGDIPAHHKKVSERYREKIEERVFAGMTEITDTVGERRGQRVNRGDMKAIEEWLIERGLGQAFEKVLM